MFPIQHPSGPDILPRLSPMLEAMIGPGAMFFSTPGGLRRGNEPHAPRWQRRRVGAGTTLTVR
jgi:hypothetical protein